MPAKVPLFETVDGVTQKIEMYPIDANHAVQIDPERYSYEAPAPKAAPVDDGSEDDADDGVIDLPAPLRPRGRPRKESGAG